MGRSLNINGISEPYLEKIPTTKVHGLYCLCLDEDKKYFTEDELQKMVIDAVRNNDYEAATILCYVLDNYDVQTTQILYI